ncbi:hypothetical protein KM043_000366 [Ampulex compressa]|nr:hypothetical protein KM043_000366 [Ampulex compressa]
MAKAAARTLTRAKSDSGPESKGYETRRASPKCHANSIPLELDPSTTSRPFPFVSPRPPFRPELSFLSAILERNKLRPALPPYFPAGLVPNEPKVVTGRNYAGRAILGGEDGIKACVGENESRASRPAAGDVDPPLDVRQFARKSCHRKSSLRSSGEVA